MGITKSTLTGFVLFCLVFLAGPVSAGEDFAAPLSVAGAETIDTATAKALFDDGALFVDVRPDADWDAGRIAGAEHLSVDDAFTEDALADLAGRDENIIVYCNGVNCPRSSKAASEAVSWGFTNMKYYREGYPGWEAAGNPIE